VGEITIEHLRAGKTAMEGAVVVCIILLGSQGGCAKHKGLPSVCPPGEARVVFQVKGNTDLELYAYGKYCARTGRPFVLKNVLPRAHMISVRSEDDGSTTFLLNTNDPIVFWKDGPVRVRLVDRLYDSRTKLETYTVTVMTGGGKEIGDSHEWHEDKG